MGLKLNVGISKKVGLPNYGSLGASCHIEVELDPESTLDEANGIQNRVTQVFGACREAVDGELTRQQKPSPATLAVTPSKANGSADGPDGHNGHGASQKQLDYAMQLAGQIPALGVRRLEKLTIKMFNKPSGELSSLEASGLIDMLKAIKEGKIDLRAAVQGAKA